MFSFVRAAALCGLLLPGCRDGGAVEDPVSVASARDRTAAESTPPLETPPHRDESYARWIERLKNFGPGVPEAEAAIPEMIALAASTETPPTLRRQIVLMLGRLGAPASTAVPMLRGLLSEPALGDDVPAAWSAKALALLGPPAREAVPELGTLLRDETTPREARRNALEALGRIGGEHPDTLPLLIGFLEAPPTDEWTQQQLEWQLAVVDALTLIGPNAAGAMPVLIRRLEHPQELLRARVLAALAAIGPSASFAEHAIAERLVFDADPDVRRQAALALGALGPTESHLLLTLSEDSETEVRRLSALGLGRFRRLDEESRGALLNLSRDDEPGVRLEAARALAAQKLDRPRAIATLLELMLAEDRTVRVDAARLLEEWKPTAAELDLDARREDFQRQPESQRLLERMLRNLGLSAGPP